MAEAQVQTQDETLIDPIQQRPGFEETESKVAIWGHPLHAMTGAFPVAPTLCAFEADGLYWWPGDAFSARAGVRAAGTAFLFGLAAGATGPLEHLMVPGIRARAPPPGRIL